MKKICIIYTGGTIGMVPTEQGYAPKEGFLNRAIASIPELNKDSKDTMNRDIMPDWTLIELSPLLDSSDITVKHWNRMADLIEENYEAYDGFVVLHGTDTMAYTASALSFMLQHLNKPVIFTGSQIPLSMVRSDGRDNLITSVLIAGQGMVNEVCLYFGGQLLRGNRAVKASADQFIAFDSPNYPAIARVGIDINYRRELMTPADLDGQKEIFRVQKFREAPIGVIKIFPGIQFKLFESIMTESLEGIVLETFGAGNIPAEDGELLHLIRKASDHGSIIVVCSQCPQGTVHLGAYESSAALVQAGAVSGYDLTTEAAIAKLYYLFSLGLDKQTIRQKMTKNLRGEMTIDGE